MLNFWNIFYFADKKKKKIQVTAIIIQCVKEMWKIHSFLLLFN